MSGRFASDFTRSFAHWLFLGVVLGATALLPPEWWPANPIRVVDVLVREGWTPWLLVAVAGNLLLAGAGFALVRGHVDYARSHGNGV
jgi:hypothetical protein